MMDSKIISIRLRNIILEGVEEEAARQHRDRNNLIEFWLMQQLGLDLERPRGNSSYQRRKKREQAEFLDPEVEEAIFT
jgi:hypothetical protein